MSSQAVAPVRLSRRVAQISPSATVGLAGRIAAMRAEGIDIISFGQGEPDFPTPDALKQAGIAAIEQNKTRYTPVGGPTELRAAIARRVSSDTGITYTPAQVSVTTGAKEGLFLAFLALCDPGDEVIIPAPYWVSYLDQVRIAEATSVSSCGWHRVGFQDYAGAVAQRALAAHSRDHPEFALQPDRRDLHCRRVTRAGRRASGERCVRD